MNGKGCAFMVLGVPFVLPAIVICIVVTYKGIVFDREIGGRLKRAADANSTVLAKQELEAAVKRMEEWHMTEGYTSVVYTTPDEDVGFWYTNIKTCLDQINALPDTATQGERDLVLMKLRQTLLDHRGGHEKVTMPSGISLFPYNTAYCLVGWLFVLMFCVGAVLIFAGFVCAKE